MFELFQAVELLESVFLVCLHRFPTNKNLHPSQNHQTILKLLLLEVIVRVENRLSL